MLGYIKLVVRKKSDLLVIHNGANGFTNGVIKMKDVRKLAKCVREVDKDQSYWLILVFHMLSIDLIKTLDYR